MRFFTPELYVRFNSSDEDQANAADAAWEAALQGYQKHLDGIRERLPSQVRKLSALNLHDAEVLAFEEVAEPAFTLPSEGVLRCPSGRRWPSCPSARTGRSSR